MLAGIELKTILIVASLVVGSLLVLGPYLQGFVQNAKNANSSLRENLSSIMPTSKANPPSITSLEEVLEGLDSSNDKEEIDYLINKVGPKLIRKRLVK